MNQKAEIVHLKKLQQDRARLASTENISEIPERYAGDIRRFREYCAETGQMEDVNALLNYLHHSITVHKVKKSTFERRYYAAKKRLEVVYGLKFTDEQQAEFKKIRKMYAQDAHIEQTRREGKLPAVQNEIMDMIRALDDPRDKAVCFVGLISAARPSEMVRLKVEHFDLTGRSVSVYMKKQQMWHYKRLTQEAVKAVRDYIRAYGLQKEDYFVGRVHRSHGTTDRGRYESVQITEVGYNNMIQRLLGVAPYVLRKTQVSAMHENGADVATIAKQTGHQSIKTLTDHYLSISDTTVDRYL